MMYLFVTMVLLMSSRLLADTSTCVNLAHVLPIGAGEFHVQQPDCDRWVRQSYFKDQPYGEADEIIFSTNFTKTQVDDRYETYTSSHRWFWASSQQDILIHEYSIGSVDK